MFFSLVQTLVCVLLINGGLYALHLTGNGNGSGGGGGGSNAGSASSSTSSASVLQQSHHHQQQQQQQQQHANSQNVNAMLNALAGSQQHAQHSGGGGGGVGLRRPTTSSSLETASGRRLSEELADMAQLERERLMLLGLAKQTAAAANAGSTGHHGRPIITGRIQMTPAEEVESDYPALLMQQARGFMFGNVVRHPTQADDDYDTAADDYDSGGAGGRPMQYEYGRVVQPAEHQPQQAATYDPQHVDLDAFMELEAAAEEDDDMLPDLDGYQYLDELLAEQQRKGAANDWAEHHQQAGAGYSAGGYRAGGSGGVHHAGRLLQNPYQTLEELESHPPQALQELFEKEQRDEAVQQHQQQQQPQLQRNIFGHQKQHHYNLQHNSKLALANSEATASKHVGGKTPIRSSSLRSGGLSGAAPNIKNNQQQSAQALTNTDGASTDGASSTSAASATATASESTSSISSDQTGAVLSGDVTAKLQQQQQQPQDQLQHPTANHKRSGLPSAAAAGGVAGVGYSSIQSPVTHSIASQLMLRTARGQRQYDVPQIECPTAMDGMERFACPTPDLQGRYRCIDDHVLCDGFIDCPEGEDEDRRSCMFYKTTKAHLDVLADALLRWARGR